MPEAGPASTTAIRVVTSMSQAKEPFIVSVMANNRLGVLALDKNSPSMLHGKEK